MSLLDEPVPQDDQMRDRARQFEEFLNDDALAANYKDDIARMLRTEQTRLIVNIDDLRDYRRELADGLLKQPVEYLPAFDDALQTIAKLVHDPEKHEVEGKNYRIGLSGSFGDHHVSPRTLKAEHLGKMISLEGIITRCSLVRPKMLKSVAAAFVKAANAPFTTAGPPSSRRNSMNVASSTKELFPLIDAGVRKKDNEKANFNNRYYDMFWALLNCNEFLLNH